ncbi:hypothetical protein Godav_026524 [Gossypium davidsonii]|uniref:Uncharacterized protein n=2 Tax=Gossypium TaxID=3633 RepID=A0A7J8RT73_GOSDV|nr:hypothetical protein [Gossypium davidsonii]MBA0652342.1 hypothetical protein [Gossypium klotzschianum]
MAVSFPGFPWRFSRGASKEKQPVVKGASLNSGNSSSDWGAETVKFQTKISGNGKWQGSEERRVIDKEFDVVVVPSDGIHLSGYESDGPLGGKNPSALAFMVMKMMVDTLFSEVLGYYEVGIYDSEKMDQQSLMQTVQMTIIAAIMATFFLPPLLFHSEQSLVVSDNTANIVNHSSQLNASANSFLWNGMKLWTYNFISLAPLNSIVQFLLMTCEPGVSEL